MTDPTYRTTGAWGSGKGANLTAAEVDGNFYGLATRIGTLEGAAGATGISSVAFAGTTLTITLSDGTVHNFTMPTTSHAPATTINVAGTAFQPDLSDANCYLRLTSATGCAVSIPDETTVTFVAGTEIEFVNAGGSAVTFAADTGVSFNLPFGKSASMSTLGAAVRFKLVDSDVWDVHGDLDDVTA